MLNINISTRASMMEDLRDRYKKLRLFFNLTQEGLAKRSGVSLGSLKRFEKSGQISLNSLLKLSLVLGCIDDFGHIAEKKELMVDSIDELLEQKESVKKRGSIK